jgi:hypothetical protein
MTKPFLGAFKDKELKKFENKYCGLCNHKGLIGHITTIPIEYKITNASGIFASSKDDKWVSKREAIDAYWCPQCNKPLSPSQTKGKPD